MRGLVTQWWLLCLKTLRRSLLLGDPLLSGADLQLEFGVSPPAAEQVLLKEALYSVQLPPVCAAPEAAE